MSANTIETKVIAAAAGSGAGAAVGSFCLWLLGVTIWHAPNGAGQAASAVAAVPAPVAGLTLAALAAVGGFISGYVAPHTARSADQPAPESALPALGGVVEADTSEADAALSLADEVHPLTGSALTPDKAAPYMGGG